MHQNNRVITYPNVMKAKELMDKEYNKYSTSIILAREIGCDDHQLRWQFLKEVGIPIRDYLAEVRIRHAAQLIAKGTKIEAVSSLVGYKSKKNFLRRFKKVYNTTPKKWYIENFRNEFNGIGNS